MSPLYIHLNITKTNETIWRQDGAGGSVDIFECFAYYSRPTEPTAREADAGTLLRFIQRSKGSLLILMFSFFSFSFYSHRPQHIHDQHTRIDVFSSFVVVEIMPLGSIKVLTVLSACLGSKHRRRPLTALVALPTQTIGSLPLSLSFLKT